MNNTIIGALAIIFSMLVPMMPGMSHASMIDKSTVPPGWTYSPSSWLQRLPIIALGFFGFLIARYLAAYQRDESASAPNSISKIPETNLSGFGIPLAAGAGVEIGHR